jgi:hypothetical protein
LSDCNNGEDSDYNLREHIADVSCVDDDVYFYVFHDGSAAEIFFGKGEEHYSRSQLLEFLPQAVARHYEHELQAESGSDAYSSITPEAFYLAILSGLKKPAKATREQLQELAELVAKADAEVNGENAEADSGL